MTVADRELERTQVVASGPEEVFAFFAEPKNLEAITPRWLRFRIVEAPDRLEAGSLIRYRLRLLGVPVGWQTEIVAFRPPRTFVDRQLAGPYRRWVHTHRFRAVAGGTEVYDHVRYRVPGGPLAGAVDRLFVRPRLDAIFAHRAAALERLITGSSDGGPGGADAY